MIWFLRLLWLALWWKNFVFLSPAYSQIGLDRCLHVKSSWYNNLFISLFTMLMLSILSPIFCFVRSSNSFCFSSNFALVSPKANQDHPIKAILQCLIFSNNLNIELPLGCTWFQATSMTSSQSRCEAHFSSNRWGIFFLQVEMFVLWVVSKIGIWSEYGACRWVTWLWGKSSLHSNVAQARSSLYWTNSPWCLPLFHVYLFPVYPRSIRLQWRSALQKASIKGAGFGIRPCFSYNESYNPQYITMALCIRNGGALVDSMFHVDDLHLAGHKSL